MRRMLLAKPFSTLALVIGLLLVAAPAAQADFGLAPESFKVDTLDPTTGEAVTQAGAHPADFVTAFELNAKSNGLPFGTLRDVHVGIPEGLVASLKAAPACPRASFDAFLGTPGITCPVDSQIGIARVKFALFGITTNEFPIYNIEPVPGQLADFAFVVQTVPIHIVSSLDPGRDYSVSSDLAEISGALPVLASTVSLWGVPADSSHDGERACDGGAYLTLGVACSATSRRAAFITNPSSCAGPQTSTIAVDSWQAPAVASTASYSTSSGLAGCDRLHFDPEMTARTTTNLAGSSSGISIDLTIPPDEDADGLATPPLRDVDVTLPEGMSINPASAAGLRACTDGQLGLGTDDEVQCPESSKLGSVTVESPLLQERLEGAVFLMTQGSNDPESGQMFRLAMVLEQPSHGLLIKLPGQLKVSGSSGRIRASFDDNPQLPVSSVRLDLKDGPRAALQTPRACGTYMVDYSVSSWSGQEVMGQSPIAITEGCGQSALFTPALEAGTTDPFGGAYSPFTLRVTQASGEQNLSKLSATLPKGLLAKLAGVPVCGDAQAATGDCPAGSQVGTTTVGAGAGSNPIYVPEAGKAPTAVYLAGPYKGAPYSLVVVVPAEAGPFSLGTVVVRNALRIDPTTTQVTAESDPLPQILAGVPISYRDVRVDVNRNEFTVNPTSCGEQQVSSTLTAATGATANPSSRFQVAGCERLAFKPKLALRVFGKTNRNVKPRFRAVLTTRPGEANIARAQVNLPHSEFLENAHLDQTCTRPVLLAGECPARTVYGRARAWTPLLDEPLEGNVYLVGGYGYKLPALVADLGGQIRVLLVGKVDSGPNKGIRNTFEFVPDAPVSKFMLELKGGKKGILVNSEPLCSKKAKTHAIVRFTGQNGRVEAFKPKVANECGKRGKKGGKKRH